jgi:ABC-type Fe3+-hydroxamate transport system substrate-binding protein
LALIGAGDLVVAVGDWVGWPPELAQRPKLGAYDTPSEERLLELGVDTLVTTASSAGLAAVETRAGGTPRRRVLVAFGRDPLYVAGPGSHFDELVRLAGGENIAHDLGAPYALASEEAMLARAPEVILDSSDNRAGAPRGATPGSWSRWRTMPAVAAGRVYHLDPVRLSIPGPRLGEMAELVGRLIHPELFGPPAPAEFGPLDSARAQ